MTIAIHNHGADWEGGTSLAPVWSPRLTPITAAYTAKRNELVQVTSGTFTVTLTSAVTVHRGGIICVANQGTGVTTIDGFGAETIDGAATTTVSQYEAKILISNGTNWVTLAQVETNDSGWTPNVVEVAF